MDLFDERPAQPSKPYLGLEFLLLTLVGLVLLVHFFFPLDIFFLPQEAFIPEESLVNDLEKGFASEGLLFGQRFNVNRAQKRDLETLPGIGPTLAERIISFRKKNGPFQMLGDLKRVKGVGPRKYAQIKPYLKK